MPPPTPLPKYIYKIVPTAPPSPLPDAYPLSDLDKKDGFVHLSTAKQIPITADIWFKDSTSLYILKIHFAKFQDVSTWDVPNNDGCAHLYGNFGAADVESVEGYERADGQKWSEVLAKSGWLE